MCMTNRQMKNESVEVLLPLLDKPKKEIRPKHLLMGFALLISLLLFSPPVSANIFVSDVGGEWVNFTMSTPTSNGNCGALYRGYCNSWTFTGPAPKKGDILKITNVVTAPGAGASVLYLYITDSKAGTHNSYGFSDGVDIRYPYASASGITTISIRDSNYNLKIASITMNGSYPVPVANFTGAPTNGHAPLNVSFTDTSNGTPTSWSWAFGDGQNSIEQNPVHTYSAPGTYQVSHSATNPGGTGWKNVTAFVNVAVSQPVADFTGTPLSGTIPLTVVFTDTSTGSPTTWSWAFGDGGTSSEQNPMHNYSAAGTYNISLTAANAGGSNTTVRAGYVTVTAPQMTYYVYAEAGDSGTGISDMANGFWNTIKGSSNGNTDWGDWQNSQTIIDPTSARESHWTGDAANWIQKSDFAYFSGHGNRNMFAFENSDENYPYLNYSDSSRISLGIGRTKWAVIDACESLNYTSWENWNPSFNGLHMLLGWNTSTVPSYDNHTNGRGAVFAQLMTGNYMPTGRQILKMSDAWDWAGKYTWGVEPTTSSFDVYDAVIYDTNCQNDYLPGWGSDCTVTSGSQEYQSTLIFKQNSNSGNSNLQFSSINLAVGKYSIAASVPVAKNSTMVYAPVKSGYTREFASSLAKSLGMSGNLRETENAFYANDTDADKYYFVVRKDTPMISFQKLNSRSGLPQSKDQSVSAVNAYLRKNNLLPPGDLEPEVVNNVGERFNRSGERHLDWKTNVITYPQVINGLPVLNAQFTVEVDSHGNIIGLFKNWCDYKPYRESNFKSPDTAFGEFRIKNLQSQKGNSNKIVVTNVSLGYYMQSSDTVAYLQPGYTFEGYYQNGNSTEPFDPVIIPAIQDVLISPTPTTKIDPKDNVTGNVSTSITAEVTALPNISIPGTSPTIISPTMENLTTVNVTHSTPNDSTSIGTVNGDSTELLNMTKINGSISGNMTVNTSA
jgi:PKD repeat protein